MWNLGKEMCTNNICMDNWFKGVGIIHCWYGVINVKHFSIGVYTYGHLERIEMVE